MLCVFKLNFESLGNKYSYENERFMWYINNSKLKFHNLVADNISNTQRNSCF